MKNSRVEIEPIGVIRSCFEEKFATPRQPGLCPSAWALLHFHEKYRGADFLRGIEGFSHLWIIFGFHQTADQSWSATVRPPRLGGNDRVGVFASRSTYRPNGLGLSLCQLEAVVDGEDGPALRLAGLDCVDGTPVYDIKPYLAYAEAIANARCGYAQESPLRKEVVITAAALPAFSAMNERDQAIVMESLALDPRPAAHQDPARVYGAMLCGKNVRFVVRDAVEVVGIDAIDGGNHL
jgi:tRNA-Thr(GGU) m(6)t(6)A37 methyltransferase TsaA